MLFSPFFDTVLNRQSSVDCVILYEFHLLNTSFLAKAGSVSHFFLHLIDLLLNVVSELLLQVLLTFCDILFDL